jgi:5'(3')-deoxyribonucleotidase
MMDMDGVCYKWHSAVYEYFKLYKDYCGTYNDLWGKDYLKFTDADWEYLTKIDTFYSSQIPTVDCVNFLDKVKDLFDIYYVTSRPEYVKLTTEQYLKRYKFPFRENLIFTNDKVNTARRLRADFCIDDLPKHIEGLSKVSKVVMIAQPYNKEYQDKYPTSRTLMGTLQYLIKRTDTEILTELGYEAG